MDTAVQRLQGTQFLNTDGKIDQIGILGDKPQRIQILFTLKMISKYLRVNTRKQTLRNERGTSHHVHTLLKIPGPYLPCNTEPQ